MPFGLSRPSLHPRFNVRRRDRVGDLTTHPDQQHGERMLARLPAARAGTGEAQVGVIDHRLVRLGTTPLERPPHRPRVCAEMGPSSRGRERLSRRHRCRRRSDRRHLLDAPPCNRGAVDGGVRGWVRHGDESIERPAVSSSKPPDGSGATEQQTSDRMRARTVSRATTSAMMAWCRCG